MVLRAYYFFAFAAMGVYLPYFPTWLRSRGFIGWQMSVLYALLPICQLASPSVVGVLADKLALRGRLITFCAVVTAIGVSLFAVSTRFLDPVPFLIAFTCMFAFAALRAPLVGLAEVLAIENTTDYGRMRLFGSLGFMTAALLGGRFLDPTHAYALPAVVAALIWGLALVSLLLPRTSNMPPRPAVDDARVLLRQPTFRGLLITMVLVFIGMSGYDLIATLRLQELSASGPMIGAFWAIATFSEVILLFWARPLLGKMGPGKGLTLACAFSTLRWAFLSQATSLSLILALQPLHALSFGLMWVSAVGVLSREVGQNGTATAQGLFASSVALGATVGVSLWGIIYDTHDSRTVFLGASCAALFATISASKLIVATRPNQRLAPLA